MTTDNAEIQERPRGPDLVWWAVAALLLILLVPALQFVLPMYRQARLVGDLRERNLAVVITSPGGSTGLQSRLGDAWRDGRDEVRIVYASTRDKFTDEEAARLRVFEHLQDLDLGGTAITNAALKHVGSLTNLKRLALENTQISDEGLASLVRLRQLGVLTLQGTRVTPAGIAELKKSLPDTLIVGPE